MIAQDPFSQYYHAFLDDTYDVVDRIILNGYCSLLHSPGGFRCWWRDLHGTDDNLDDTHLMRMAGRFARRVRGWAQKNNIPVIDCPAGERKCDIAETHLPADPNFRGIFAVLVGLAPAKTWKVERYGNGGINLRSKEPWSWVKHYSFHIIDEQWGHMTIKISGHPPFLAQIMLNGHEYVGYRARQAGIVFVKEGNCYTNVSDAAGLAKVAEALRCNAAVGHLRRVCERWIYRCLCFGLSFDEQKKSGFGYNYSVYQVEYSRNLLFKNAGEMEQVFSGVIDRTRAPLDIRTIKTIFGYKRRPKRKGKTPRFEVVVERPVYDLTIFKVHFGRLTLKIYTKGERVLRIEAIAHNTKDLRCGRTLEKFPILIDRLSGMLQRFLQVLRCVDVGCIADGTLDELPRASVVGKSKVGGIDLNNPRMRAVFGGAMALSPSPDGFSSAQLAAKVREITGDLYTPRQAAYDLKKLRGKDFIRHAARRPRYAPTARGLRAMAALTVLREKVLKPLLAGAAQQQECQPPEPAATIDAHYRCLRIELRNLFTALGIAA